jgi:hypothetical protein
MMISNDEDENDDGDNVNDDDSRNDANNKAKLFEVSEEFTNLC